MSAELYHPAVSRQLDVIDVLKSNFVVNDSFEFCIVYFTNRLAHVGSVYVFMVTYSRIPSILLIFPMKPTLVASFWSIDANLEYFNLRDLLYFFQ